LDVGQTWRTSEPAAFLSSCNPPAKDFWSSSGNIAPVLGQDGVQERSNATSEIKYRRLNRFGCGVSARQVAPVLFPLRGCPFHSPSVRPSWYRTRISGSRTSSSKLRAVAVSLFRSFLILAGMPRNGSPQRTACSRTGRVWVCKRRRHQRRVNLPCRKGKESLPRVLPGVLALTTRSGPQHQGRRHSAAVAPVSRDPPIGPIESLRQVPGSRRSSLGLGLGTAAFRNTRLNPAQVMAGAQIDMQLAIGRNSTPDARSRADTCPRAAIYKAPSATGPHHRRSNKCRRQRGMRCFLIRRRDGFERDAHPEFKNFGLAPGLWDGSLTNTLLRTRRPTNLAIRRRAVRGRSHCLEHPNVVEPLKLGCSK